MKNLKRMTCYKEKNVIKNKIQEKKKELVINNEEKVMTVRNIYIKKKGINRKI